ncbi:hypothetical protein [Fusobacterium gastrosuis]|uniref:hypothetical protein n=1 Tax=Fusobacterium gastrosuis TaxID=1755100 RepID=UPI0029753D58|nr:hypothetical protein [Fusobacteriaceae bacterium]MDY3359136.1 hypothetical protein [Clostridium celatum]MDY5713845.1 hypothetical protein [Fusobacterium gastrosuis]
MTLGERIKKYRKENVITVKEFVNVLGVPTEFLKKVEAGELSIEAPAILDKLKKLIGDIPEPTLENIDKVLLELNTNWLNVSVVLMEKMSGAKALLLNNIFVNLFRQNYKIALEELKMLIGD